VDEGLSEGVAEPADVGVGVASGDAVAAEIGDGGADGVEALPGGAAPGTGDSAPLPWLRAAQATRVNTIRIATNTAGARRCRWPARPAAGWSGGTTAPGSSSGSNAVSKPEWLPVVIICLSVHAI
jgi:hypothetical protein